MMIMDHDDIEDDDYDDNDDTIKKKTILTIGDNLFLHFNMLNLSTLGGGKLGEH